MSDQAPRKWRYCPEPYKKPMSAWMDLIRWGPACLGPTQLVVVQYIVERTMAYGKPADASSLEQFVTGIYSHRSKTWVRPGCGLSATATKHALASLRREGLVISRRRSNERGHQSSEYQINWDALHSLFRAREQRPLGPQETKGLGHNRTKPLGRERTNNKGGSSSKEDMYKGGSELRTVLGEASTKRGLPSPAATSSNPDDPVAAKFELVRLCRERAHQLTQREWIRISEELELKSIDLCEFVRVMRPHLENPATTRPVGLILSKIKDWSLSRRPVLPADIETPTPVSPPAKCPLCGGVEGRGARIQDGKVVACECATPEFRQQVERARERDDGHVSRIANEKELAE